MKDLSLIELIEKIQSKETSAEKVWEYFLWRIEKYDKKIGAYNFVNKNGLNTDSHLPLAGAPIGVKDIFCETGVPTTCSSKMLENFVPPYDATVIKNLKEAWFSSLWKLNMDEFAMGSTTENSAFQNTVNPWGTHRIPGGSSGGSAAWVAAWLCPAALWTDTWGSIRQPASMCNIVWFKPSYGRNSRYWVIPMASSLDCPGTLTKTVRDAWILYEIMNGEDVLENTSIAGKDTINPIIWEKKDLKWLKVGLPREYFEEWIDKWVKNVILEAVEKMKELWAEIIDISLPMTKYAIATYYIIVPAEVSTNLGRLDGLRYGYSSEKPYTNMNDFYLHNRGEGFWEEAQRRSILWAYVLSAGFYDSYYKKAWQIRTLIRDDFQKAFEIVDVIVSPVSPNVAWKIGEKIDDPLKNYLADAYTIPASLAWLPGISVPAWFAQSEDAEKELLPVWLQILAPQFADQKVLEVAHVYEQATQFWKKNPPWFED